MPASTRLKRLTPNGPDNGLEPLDLDPADFQSDLPKQHWHLFFEDPAIGLNVGVWDTTTMQEAFGPYPGDEFVWVLEGSFAMIDGQGAATDAGMGDCVAFRNGAPMSWKQEGYLKKYFITLLDPNAPVPALPNADGAVIVMDEKAPLTRCSDPGEPVEREHVSFTNDAGTMSVGLWDCEAAHFPMDPFPVHEFVVVLEGGCSITEEDGTRHDIKSGDCFFIPRGCVCQWDIPTYIKKYYAQVSA